MRRLLAFSCALLLAGIFCLSQQEHVSAYWQSRDSNYNVAISGGSGCSQATILNAALSGQNIAAVTTLICGMVTDGTYAKLQGLYVAATNSIGNFEVNWANPGTFNLTAHNAGNCTFTANTQIKGDGSTCYFDTGFVPSVSGGALWTGSTGNLGACITVANTGGPDVPIGTFDGVSNYAYLQPGAGTNFNYEFQGGSFPTVSTTTTGGFIVTRATSANITLYINGSAQTPAVDLNGSVINQSVFLLAFDFNGSPSDFGNGAESYFLYGGALTSTDVGNIRTRLNTYLGTVGAGTGC